MDYSNSRIEGHGEAVSESNLPPERWRPLFDRAGIEFGYRPLAARAGLTHTRVHRLIRGGGTTAEAIEQVAEALGVKASKIRELRDEPADPEPFTLPDDAGRLTHDERDVIRAMVRALLDARNRHDQADQSSPDSAGPSPAEGASGRADQKMAPVHAGDVDSGTDPEGKAADEARPNVWRDKPTSLSDRQSRRRAGRDFTADPIVELPHASHDRGPDDESESERARRLQDEQGEESQE